MKKIIYLFSILALLSACDNTTDRKAQLAELIKQRDALNEQIAKLQTESGSGTDPDGNAGTAKSVVITTVAPQPFNHYIEIQGRVDGDENIGVNPMMPGVISRVAVKVGDRVRKGQVLAEIDAEVTRKNLQQLEEQLDFANTVYQKQKNLWDQKIGSEIQYLSAKNSKESLENSIKVLQETLSMSKITSPIDGTVEEIPIKVGQAVSPGYPAIRVINFSKIKVLADLAEAYGSKVKPGDVVKIYFPDYSKEVESRITFVSKYINPTNRTFQAEAVLNSPDGTFKANMIAVMKINDYSVPQAITVPVNVVQRSQDGQFLFVSAEEGGKAKARKRPITVGMIYNGLAEIRSGLAAGDKVITAGYQDLFDGRLISY